MAEYKLGEAEVDKQHRARFRVSRDGEEVAIIFEDPELRGGRQIYGCVFVSMSPLTWSATGREVLRRGACAEGPDARRALDSLLYDFTLRGIDHADAALTAVVDRVERVFAAVAP